MSKALKQLSRQVKALSEQRLAAQAASAATAPAAGATAAEQGMAPPATAEPAGKSTTPTSPSTATPTGGSPAAQENGMTPDEIKALVSEGMKAAMPEIVAGVKSQVDEQLASVRQGRQTPFDTGTAGEPSAQTGLVAARGVPGFMRKSSGPKTNLDWLCALGRKALGYSDMSEVMEIRHELDQRFIAEYGSKALSEANFAAIQSGTASDYNTGGALVPIGFDTSIIDYLWPNVIMRKGGARVVPMQVAELLIPRVVNYTGLNYGVNPPLGPTFNPTAEGGLIPATQMKFGQAKLRPQEVATIVAVSRQLVVDSDPSVEMILRDALVQSIATYEDGYFLLGDGVSPDIKGLFSYTNATDGCSVLYPTTTAPYYQLNGAAPANGAALTYDIFIGAINTLQGLGIPFRKPAWIMHPNLLGAARRLRDGNGRPIFSDYINIQKSTLNGDDLSTQVPTLMGYPVLCSQQLPINQTQGTATTCTNFALIDMDEVMIGQRGVLEITTSTDASWQDVGAGSLTSAFQQNQILYRVIERVDMTLRRPQGLAIVKNVAL